MSLRVPARPAALPSDRTLLRRFAEQAFSRTAGAPLVDGNRVRVLRDATENYPAWEAAIGEARRSVHIEMYIFHRDRVGRRFVELLTAKARAGVSVRLVYDWFGCGTGPALGLFAPLVAAGGQVRAFNPPSITSALGWLRRNHRKMIVVDGRTAFIAGLCIGAAWEGRPERGLEPWRDTGLEVTGPVVAHAEQSFDESWRLAGGPPEPAHHAGPPADACGDVHLRLIATEPFTANMLRLDLLVAALAQQSLWIADAYFIGTGPYLESLKRAASDGVDVRLLLPQDSDVGWTVPVSRSLYRPLLEAGVRIFEWQGTMIHAKTAVADGRWARVGSTNLNLNSWMGNWEMDVAIEDPRVARTLKDHYEEDLERSTEIVLQTFSQPWIERRRAQRGRRRGRRQSRRVVRAVTGVGRSIGAAISGNRPLEEFELGPITSVGLVLAAIAAVGFFAPRVLAWPAALIAGWTALTFFAEAWAVRKRRSQLLKTDSAPAPAPVLDASGGPAKKQVGHDR
ncbi:MAG: phospholipase D-like domain-containing protein [Vicinamibacterales bacterium]